MLISKVIPVVGMSCAACAATIEKTPAKTEGAWVV